jgi:hypothetical protein
LAAWSLRRSEKRLGGLTEYVTESRIPDRSRWPG